MTLPKMKGYGLYENIPSSVKAEAFGFEIDDSSGDLKLYMQVIKALGVRMEQEEMFEDYQKVYEETIKKQDDYDMKKENWWEHGRARGFIDRRLQLKFRIAILLLLNCKTRCIWFDSNFNEINVRTHN